MLQWAESSWKQRICGYWGFNPQVGKEKLNTFWEYYRHLQCLVVWKVLKYIDILISFNQCDDWSFFDTFDIYKAGWEGDHRWLGLLFDAFKAHPGKLVELQSKMIQDDPRWSKISGSRYEPCGIPQMCPNLRSDAAWMKDMIWRSKLEVNSMCHVLCDVRWGIFTETYETYDSSYDICLKAPWCTAPFPLSTPRVASKTRWEVGIPTRRPPQAKRLRWLRNDSSTIISNLQTWRIPSESKIIKRSSKIIKDHFIVFLCVSQSFPHCALCRNRFRFPYLAAKWRQSEHSGVEMFCCVSDCFRYLI